MRNKTIILCLLLSAAVGWPLRVAAQSSSINAFSPYTFYGLGDLSTQGTAELRSMGGTGVAFRGMGLINYLNPASYSSVGRKTFLFNFGMEGANYYERSGTTKNSFNTFNVRDVAVAFPIAGKLGFAVSVTPYSSVGYRVSRIEQDDDVWADIGQVRYDYEGSGGVTQFKAGAGWEPFKNFSIGAELIYYMGSIDRTYGTVITNVTGTGDYGNAGATQNSTVSKFLGNFGVQYSPIYNRKTVLTLGATYRMGGALGMKVNRYVPSSSVVMRDTTYVSGLHMPSIAAFGFFLHREKWSIGADYQFSAWSNGNEPDAVNGIDFADTHQIRLGAQYTPKRRDVRRTLNRWTYRAGFRYGNYYLRMHGHSLMETAVTLGVGIPLRFDGVSSINVGLEYGRMGSASDGLIRQNVFKFSIGFSLFGGDNDYWFIKQKYD